MPRIGWSVAHSMSHESVSFMKVINNIFEKNNAVFPESDEQPLTEEQVYSCFNFHLFFVAFVLHINKAVACSDVLL